MSGEIPQAPPAKPVSSASVPSEEDRFFEFTKKYIALLAAVASIPLVTGAIGVLEPPETHKQLSILASAFSVVMFGSVYLLRSMIGRAMRHTVWAVCPVTFIVIGLLGTWKAAGTYIDISEQFKPQTPEWQAKTRLQSWQTRELASWYLPIYPLFSFSLGLLAVSAFTQQKSNTIQSIVAERLMDKADELERRLTNLSHFYALSEGKKQETFQKLGHDLVVDENGRHLAELAEGVIDMRGEQALKLQMTLQRCFNHRFDAVSKTDLNFWCPSKRDTFANEYLKINADGVKNNASVNRIFLLEDGDLLRTRIIQETLIEQESLGIGWGLAPMEALDPLVKGDEVHDLDFALFNLHRALSFFREPDNRFRRLEVIFDVDRPENLRRIWEQTNRFLELITQCWFVNQPFAEHLDELSRFVPTVREEREKRGWTPRNDGARAKAMSSEDWFKYVIAKAAISELGKFPKALTAQRYEILTNVLQKLKEPGNAKPTDVQWKDCFLFGIAGSEEDTRAFVAQALTWRRSAADWKEVGEA